MGVFTQVFNFFKNIGNSIKSVFNTVLGFLSFFPDWVVALIIATFGLLLAILVMKIIKTILDAIPLA